MILILKIFVLGLLSSKNIVYKMFACIMYVCLFVCSVRENYSFDFHQTHNEHID